MVLLAEAGAGKTFEMEARANALRESGHAAFFIRIEDIDADFENAFEVGTRDNFAEWLSSTHEGWFFLDSIDESRLDNPRTFEKAIKRFGSRIRQALQRTHIVVSSRPYAWRDVSDRRLIRKWLPYTSPREAADDDSDDRALSVYLLNPLTETDIKQFANSRETPNVDRLIDELRRTNLAPLAARPFDLEGILSKWTSDGILGGRLELLDHNIRLRLGEIDPDRRQRQPLNLEKAAQGARRLAAATLLTGESGFRVPDGSGNENGIDAEAVLNDWDPEEINTLLHRGIFNDTIYGMVRFRHREVRELLAAQWFRDFLEKGSSRRSIEALFFRKKFGQTVITPRLRPILPWLILFDDEIRRKAVALAPEIAVEGGDAAHLPYTERVALLEYLTERIAEDFDDRSARDNDSIARIAQQDLSDTTKSLIERFQANDDAIFFLARLVWKANMPDCVSILTNIALDGDRGVYARIASVRAIMACGASDSNAALWKHFSVSEDPLPRRILDELIDNADTSVETVAFLLASLERLEPYERFEATGLSQSLHDFIDRLIINTDDISACPLAALANGLHDMLSRAPYVEKRDCRVSEAYLWLLPHATHSVERLVDSRSAYAFSNQALSILLMEPAARFWKSGDYSEYETKLSETVPNWPALNDSLYWKSIEKARAMVAAGSSGRVTDDWRPRVMGHFWNFASDRFDDVLACIRERELLDDRLVALSLAFRLYIEANKPAGMKTRLQQCVNGQSGLEEELDNLLNPVLSKDQIEWQEREKKREQERKEHHAEEQKARFEWIQAVKTDPDRVRSPKGLKPGQVTNDQYWLRHEIEGKSGRDKYANGSDWQALVPEFGPAVAEAYRDAAVAHWRNYSPELGSEGTALNSTAFAEIFGLVGLQIEADLRADFPGSLSESEAGVAARYLASELNGFPTWYERLFKTHTQLVLNLFEQELIWELDTTCPDEPKHYILHDIVYYAPWLHGALSPSLHAWLENNDVPNDGSLRYVMRILVAGCTSDESLASLAERKLQQSADWRDQAFWFAVWIDVAAADALPHLGTWLRSLSETDSVEAAQIFLAQLVGTRHSHDLGDRRESYRNVSHLLELYLLMHEFVRAESDIERADTGVYSPGLRDEAQEARDALFRMLAEMRGKEVYIALSHLAASHPVPRHRPWMRRQAQSHLRDAADLEQWTAEQVSEFDRSLVRRPATHQQLFELAVSKLIDLKDWLEQGNDSPYRTWQRADDETELRNLIAGELNKMSRQHFTCAQENELANMQRPDIWLQAPSIASPVPIELKLLDKRWTGPKLCERLRNQLASDYLREDGAKCGVFLLVWQGQANNKAWKVGGKTVNIEGLEAALSSYWNNISDQFPGVDDVEVVVIDLTIRASKSQT